MKTTVAQLAEANKLDMNVANGLVKALEIQGKATRVEGIRTSAKGRNTVVYEIPETVEVVLKAPVSTPEKAAVKARNLAKKKKKVPVEAGHPVVESVETEQIKQEVEV